MNKLVHSGYSADGGIIMHMHMPGKLHHIGNHAEAADLAVVSNVHVFHQQIIAAHHGIFFHHIATVNSNKFTDGVIAANAQTRSFAFKLQILRVGA